MINSNDRLIKGYLFEEDSGLYKQHNKILEEIREVENEVIPIPEIGELYFKTTLENYIHEVLDVMLACNNQLLKMQREYGESFIKRTMGNWDKKIKKYAKEKYKE